jgi:hypothetical protein
MFTSDVETRFHELSGAGSFELYPSSDRYVIGISIQQSGTASDSLILCGSTLLAKNYGKDYPFNIVSYRCNGAINVSKTGQDSAAFIVSVIPADKYNSSVYKIEIASATASVPVNFASQSGLAMFNFFRLSWVSSACILLSLGIIAFLLFMKRR